MQAVHVRSSEFNYIPTRWNRNLTLLYCVMESSLDEVLERSLANSGGSSPQDAIVIALHSSLLTTGFVCVAVGDEEFGDEATRSRAAVSTSEHPQLPVGWNRSSDVYALQYRHERTQQTCLVKVIPLGIQLIVSALVESQMDKVFSLTLVTSKYVREVSSYNSPSIYSSLLQLVSILNRDIGGELVRICEQSLVGDAIAPGYPVGGADQETKPDRDPLRIGPPRRPDHIDDPLDPPRIGPPRGPDHIDDPLDPLRMGPPRRPIGDDPLSEFGPFGYGDRDRLPFGGGGGMIYDPLRQGPRGGSRPGFGPRGGSGPGFGPRAPYPPNHPPGARYDPVSPLGPSRPRPPGQAPRGGGGFYGPTPDHLPPPGFEDMFS